ncbi:SDR family NAD(P)-dependent oxidoreductase [Roseiflexus castenholzii]|jgi:3-oxoacyl-[acyl-carrier protein] reductase|uniref:Short-chain dehydrogenase/reductase SDR n=1 Tax=Roseiflexus castenholzii (strain DSM 13941 / HLO8) TaxID=383372 RepID=A7NMC7_ROSCS|nr:SDR family NAD(P)-dependent oxidoreductase [Roseiflexus castenholzii]ABU58689.1 short-chain dehydrogenase/reductase SDR [Roseiflexus castenholzii DSM 13941]
MTRSLEGKVAVVTGASREIGAAMAEILAAHGCAVLAAHFGEAERATVVIERIRATGGRALAYDADLSSITANRALITCAVDAFGRVDILAANAGLTISAPFLDTTEEQWDTLFDLNVKGSFFAAQAAARQMIAQGNGGRIVFSASVTGVQAIPGLSAYGITKAALRHMAKTLACELGSYGITVNALGIGAILNERNRTDDPEYETHWGSVTPTGRVGLPADVAQALLFLVSPGAAHVTGQTLIIDGGWTLTSPLPPSS